MIKLPLQPRKKSPHEKDLKAQPVEWKATLPFLENTRAHLIHRPKTVVTYRHQKIPHLAVMCYCGTGFAGGKNFTFLSAPPLDSVVCQRCEDAAVDFGLPSSFSLTGRHVHLGGLKVVLNCGCKIRDENE
mgnify:CR=1 FL=1